MSKVINSRECKFVVYLPKLEVEDDIHVVKEVIKYEDGTINKQLKVISNFKRPFWITKPHLQRYKQKKESESIDNLNKYYSTQKLLAKNISSRLGSMYVGKKTMRDVIPSPYLYGTDIDSRAIIKKIYMDKYPNTYTPYNIASLDIEVDTTTNEIIIISIASKEEVFIGILDKFIPNKRNIENTLMAMYNKYIPKTEYNKDIKPIFKLYPTEIDMLKGVIGRLHTWDIDFCAIWNINYDMTKMLELCKKNNVDPKDIFSDPNIPINLRYFEYKQGTTKKVTESGVVKPINPEEQWHVVITPAKYYWIDAMCAHRYVRVGGKTVPGGYSLDNILEVELGKEFKKLKFEDENMNNLTGIDWHIYMVENKPLEYVIYNVWDTISMLELDNKTKDLEISIGALSGISSFDIFNSGPKKIVDALHYFYLENNRVLGVKPAQQDDDTLLGLDDWIINLYSEYVKHNRTGYVEEDITLDNNVKTHVADMDAVSSYPSDTTAANVSKDTTSREILSVVGMEYNSIKRENINLFFGSVNSLSYCKNIFNFPTLKELEMLVKDKIKKE